MEPHNIENLKCAHCGGDHASEDHSDIEFSGQNASSHLINHSYDVTAIDPTSGNYNYVNDLTSGYDWDGTGGLNFSSGKMTVTYTFTNINGHWGAQDATNYSFLTAQQQAGIRSAMDEFEKVANLEFVESANSNANIIFRTADLPSGIAGWAFYPWFGVSDVTYDNSYTSYNEGQFSYRLAMHEIGHAVGLMHPEDSGYSANYDNDGTIMSYYGGSNSYYGHYSKTLQIFDIAALQDIYGANTSYNSGDTVYEVSGTNERYTIWDGGGNDTLDASSYSGNVTLNLNPAEDIVSRVGNTDIWIAYNANIENITSGDGNDNIIGNELNNQLVTGDGNDEINANNGNDDIRAGNGDDNVIGGNGADTIRGDGGNDTIQGGNGNDFIMGNWGDDVIEGASGDDDLRGGSGNDEIYGGADNDQINGQSGNDTIRGDDGDDTIQGGGGDDFIMGNWGDDIIEGASGDDDLRGGRGNDTISGGRGNDIIRGNLGDDIINGEQGVDSLNGGGGADIFVFDDLDDSTFSAYDTISGFKQGTDLIDLTSFDFVSLSDFSITKANGNTLIHESPNADSFAINFRGDYDFLDTDFIFV